MADAQHNPSSPVAPRTRWSTLGVLLVALLLTATTATPTSAMSGSFEPISAVAAQATRASDDPGSRLQPVGNGDTIDSPADTTDDSGSSDTSWWWRIVFGAAIVVVVLVALIQRRQDPDRAQGSGRGLSGGRTKRRDDRNALGH